MFDTIFLGDFMISTLALIDCNHYGNVEVIYFIKNVLTLIRVIVPIILVIMCMFDVVKTVMGDVSKGTKIASKLGKKIIAAALVFLLPSIINIVMSISEGINLTEDTCWTEATKETIEELKKQAIADANDKTQNTQDEIKNQTNEQKGDTQLNIKDNDNTSGNNNSGTAYFFLGDSRFVGMSNAVGQKTDVHWVAKTSEGHAWIKKAVVNINYLLPESGAYIFANLGVNDLAVDSYISTYKTLAQGDWKNHKLVFVAVGPKVGSGCYDNVSNKDIEEFNAKMKKGLSSISNVYYCDAYNGFGVSNYKVNGSCEIHYTNNTYKNLYNYIMNNCRF